VEGSLNRYLKKRKGEKRDGNYPIVTAMIKTVVKITNNVIAMIKAGGTITSTTTTITDREHR